MTQLISHSCLKVGKTCINRYRMELFQHEGYEQHVQQLKLPRTKTDYICVTLLTAIDVECRE